jgi:hypothetical protein
MYKVHKKICRRVPVIKTTLAPPGVCAYPPWLQALDTLAIWLALFDDSAKEGYTGSV